jgi:hypothetical protein
LFEKQININHILERTFHIKHAATLSGHISSIYCLADKVDTPYFFSAAGDGWIVQWEKDASKTDGLLLAKVDGKIFSIIYIKEHHLLVVGDFDGHVYWLDTETNVIMKRVAFHKGSIFGFSQVSANHIYSISGDGYLCKWDIHTYQPIESIKISNQGLRSIIYDDINNTIYIGASDNAIYLVTEKDLKIEKLIPKAHQNSVFSLAILPDNILLSGGRDAYLKAWSIPNLEVKQELAAHMFTINSIVHLPELHLFATASRDKSIRIWDDTTFELYKSIDVQKDGHFNSVNNLLWLPTKSTLVSASDDRTIRMWKIEKIDS